MCSFSAWRSDAEYSGSVVVFDTAAQVPVRQFESPGDVLFGAASAVVGDVNGDAVPDLVVSAPLTLTQNGRGRLLLMSGASGAPLAVVGGGP